MSFFPGKGAYMSRKTGIKRRVVWRREDQRVADPDAEPCLSCINQRRIEAEARANPSPEEMDEEMVRGASPESDPCRIIIRLNEEDDDDDDDEDNDNDNGANEVAMDEHDYGNGNGNGTGNGNGADNGVGNGNGHHYGHDNGAGNGNHSNGNGRDGGNASGSGSGPAGGPAGARADGSSGSSAGDSARGSSVSRQSGSGRSDPEPEPVAGPSSERIPSISLVNYGASTSGFTPSSFDDEEEGKRPKKKVCAKPMDLDYDDDDAFDEDSDPNNNRLQHIPTPLRPYEGYFFTADDPSGITRDDWNAAGPSGVNAGASTSKGAPGQYQTSDSSLSSSCSHHSLVDRYTHMNISGCEDQTDEECAFSESGDDADDLDDD